ncbi:RNA-directed DNA polymerase [Patescibacteria group bacterium]
MTWINKLDFERAISEIRNDEKTGKDFCLDPLRFEDLADKKIRQSLIEELQSSIDQRKYLPQDLIKIDVPKSNYTLRPGARPILIDWIVYTATVNFIADSIYKKIPKTSYSFRRFSGKKDKKFKKSVDYWLDFEDDALKLSKKSDFEYLLVTDITAFFEHISIDELKQRLKLFSNEQNYIKAVHFLTDTILSRWTINNKIPKFGLPQGPTASTVLSDIYLYSVDKALNESKHLKFIRFMDDFRLFVKNRTDLKKSISSLVKELRELKLNLNAKKTISYKLIDKNTLKNVFDADREMLRLISDAFKSKKRSQILLVGKSLSELKNSQNPTFQERHFKFFVGKIIDSMKYKIAKKQYINNLTKELLEQFKERHHLSNTLCWFFVAAGNYFVKLKPIISDTLVEFICSKKNIYEWQEMWALDTIRQLNSISEKNIKKLKRYFAKENVMCFSQFALIACNSGDHDMREYVLNEKRIKEDQYRATLLGVQELDKEIIKHIKNSTPKYFQNFFNKLSKKNYGFNYKLQDIEINDDY